MREPASSSSDDSSALSKRRWSQPAPGSSRPALTIEGPVPALLLTAAVLLTLLAITVVIWQHERSEVRNDLRADTSLVCSQEIQRFDYLISERFRPLQELEARIQALPGDSAIAAFNDDAGALMRTYPWLRLSVMVNPNDWPRDIVARPDAAPVARQRLRKINPHFAVVMDQSRQTGGEALEVYPDENGAMEAVYVVPLPPLNSRPAGTGIVYDIELDKMLPEIFDDETLAPFSIRLDSSAGKPFFEIARKDAVPDLSATAVVRVVNRPWRLTLTPTRAFVAERQKRSPMWILVGGSIISLVMAAGVWQALAHRRRDRRVTHQHLSALAALNEISLAITSAPSDSGQIFERLTRSACELMGMSSGSITLLNPLDRTMHVAYRQNVSIDPDRWVYGLDELPMCKQCMETHQPAFVPDVWRNPGPFDPQRYKKHDIRSIVVVPVIAQGKPLGAIVLADAQAKRFSTAQRQMAELWAAQAAVTIVNYRLYDRLEMLYDVNTQIQKASTVQESLDLVANLSPRLLDVDCTIVCMRDEDPNYVQVAAATKGTPAETLAHSRIPCCQYCLDVLRTGEPLTIASASGDPVLRETSLASWGSAVFLPLTTKAGDIIGLLILMRKAAIPLSSEEMHIAHLFATRASVVLENTNLYDQTRRDAEAKAMLLRELNHRVKNNLAAIVGLLSTKPRDLSPEARRWLERATERIATMARTHDLFSGGMSEVSVKELARKALASVDAIKPPGVKVLTELDDVNVQISTDRAVTLAMVLYELCCNALVHGTGESGKLLLRGRQFGDDQIAIEVIDSGAQASPLAAGKALVEAQSVVPKPANGHAKGIGLSLVEGLVGRELHGQFNLRANPAGGSTATVQFPVRGQSNSRV